MKRFRQFAGKVAYAAGTPWAFFAAAGAIVAWGLAGPLFQFSQQWQLVINSVTTIVTFLMVFVIQNTQNRDFRVLQLRLSELLRKADSTLLIDLEHLSDDDITRLEEALKKFQHPRNPKKILAALHAPEKA